LEAVEAALEPEGFQFRTMTSSMSMKARSEALNVSGTVGCVW
jgi:hypothetical protein